MVSQLCDLVRWSLALVARAARHTLTSQDGKTLYDRHKCRPDMAQEVTKMPTDRKSVVLAILAAGGGGTFTPTQLQKAAFLVSQNLTEVFAGGSRFSFAPYNYGPFDAGVYHEAEALKAEAMAEIANSAQGRWREYSASQAGVQRGEVVLNSLAPKHQEYIRLVAAWVRSLSFQQLVRSIYDHYPEMRANSIFRG